MGVPNTTTFTLQNVVDEVLPSTDDLVACFTSASIFGFDPLYSGSLNELLNFRNYQTYSGSFSVIIVNLHTVAGAGIKWSNITASEAGAANTGWEPPNGFENSQAIVSQSGHTTSAAQACLDCSGSGYTDWYLGNYDEIYKILKTDFVSLNVGLVDNGGTAITSSIHWTSEDDQNNQNAHAISTEAEYHTLKSNIFLARPLKTVSGVSGSAFNIGDFALGGVVGYVVTGSLALPDTEAPSAPGANSSSVLCQTTFTLTWGAATDNVGVTNYKIYKSTNNVIFNVYSTVGNVLTTGITGQTAAAVNYWRVTALDAVGNESTANTSISVTQTPSVTAFTMSSGGYISDPVACTSGSSDTTPYYLTGGNNTPTNGEIVYNTACATNVVNGANLFYWSEGFTFRISPIGVISNLAFC